MAVQFSTPQKNHLLANFSADTFARIFPNLELVTLPIGHVLYESGEVIQHAYFPIDSVISLLYILENGTSAGISVVGNEGVIGIPIFMGGDATVNRAVVHSAGNAYRLKANILKDEFDSHVELQKTLLHFTQALITQISQNAVCSRHHSLEQQLCRWLLLSYDRLDSNELIVTQELISNMLGVRREGVTESACNLKKAGLINYHRGRITILDRSGLEARTCECYKVVKKEYDRILEMKFAQQSSSSQPSK